MSEQEKKLDGPDFAQGLAFADIAEDGMILGHVAGEAVLLARRGEELFAIGAECTHYHGPLVEDTVRCPWHHACFGLRTGEALHAPALNPIPCWLCRATERDSICPGKGSRRQAARRGRRCSGRPNSDRFFEAAGGKMCVR